MPCRFQSSAPLGLVFCAWLVVSSASFSSARILAAEFMAGADISAVGVLEDHGAVYRDAGQPADVVDMLADHGVNWFRLRLFVDPSGQDVVVNDLAYTIGLARRAKAWPGRRRWKMDVPRCNW